MLRQIAVGKESVYGTPVTVTEFFEAQRETLKLTKEFERISTIRSNSTRQVVLLREEVAGDVEAQFNYQDCGLLFKSFFGDVDTTGAGPYTHTFPGSTGIPSNGRQDVPLTVEVVRDENLVWTYAGCHVIGFSLTCSLTQSARITWTLQGKSEATGASETSASWPDFNPGTPPNTSVSLDNGSTTLNATDLTLNASYPVDSPNVLGSTSYAVQPQDNDVLAVTGSVTVLFSSLTDYTAYYDDNADVDIQIALDDGTHSATFNLNKSLMTQMTPEVEARSRLQATYEFESIFDTTATENLQLVLINDDATIP